MYEFVYMNIIKNIIIFFLLISTSLITNAAANTDVWPYIKERLFQDKIIEEVDFLKIDGPARASSGAQVPVNIKLSQKPGIEIKKLTLIIDSNPVQKAATYHLTGNTQNLDLSTRIRMETDSFVRVVGEDSDGKLKTGLFWRPKEGYAFSNGYKPKSPPKFSKASIKLIHGKLVKIELNY